MKLTLWLSFLLFLGEGKYVVQFLVFLNKRKLSLSFLVFLGESKYVVEFSGIPK